MGKQLTPIQDKTLDDLLTEKSLWGIYKKSRAIPFSKLNLLTGFIAFACCFVFSLYAQSATDIIDQIVSLSNIAFSSTIGLLGFLLAGFSFFATVGDKRLFFRMAEIPHPESGLSFLKYNFFSFMRVFVEYLVFALATLVLMMILDKKSGGRLWLALTFGQSEIRGVAVDKIVANIFLSSVVAAIVYLLMQLKSFIYNLYHIVMTNIYWELLQSYEVEASESPVSDGEKNTETKD